MLYIIRGADEGQYIIIIMIARDAGRDTNVDYGPLTFLTGGLEIRKGIWHTCHRSERTSRHKEVGR